MLKKRLHNRLDNLFADFDDLAELTAAEQVSAVGGWAWECDGDLRYTACGENVVEYLGIPAIRFHGQSILNYAIAPQSARLLKAVFEQDVFPAEIDLYFQSPEGAYVPARVSIQHAPKHNGHKPGWRGTAQVLSRVSHDGDAVEFMTFPDVDTLPVQRVHPVVKLMTKPGSKKQSAEFTQADLAATVAVWQDIEQKLSAIQMPIDLHDQGKGVIEIVDDKGDRHWSEDERLLVQEVANQLSIAIQSAQSYALAQKAYEEMRQADHMKSQFLANMSHELRTPLNSIIGFSRVILKGIDGEINDTQRQDLSSIYNSGQHLLGLINDVLDLSKIEAGKMEMQFGDVNLIELVKSVMSTAIGLVKDKPIKLAHVLPESLPIVKADVTRIRQVLLNFLSNAAKFTEEGSITIKAAETTGTDGKPEILVTVTDTGEGIAEEDRGKLFQPFSQVDDSPTRKTGGTGLGLSICRSFMEMHKGRIGLLWSEVGKGSTFFFALPVEQDDPTANQDQ